MIVTEKELQGMCKRVDNMLFEPIIKFLEEKEDNSERKVLKYEIIKSVDEVYQEWLRNKNNPSKKEPTKEEVLLKEIANLKVDNMKKDVISTNTLKSLAELKVEIMELKGGNK